MDEQLTRKNFWIIAANSTASFVLAYLAVFYLNQFSYLLTGGMYEFPVSIDYATYFFHVEPWQWTHDSVILIFSAGYVATMFLGLLSLLAFYSLLADAMPVKIFFFWLTVHAFVYVFAGLMLGNLLTEGIGHVFNWMYLTDTVKMIISLIGFFGLLLTALFTPRLIAISANVYFHKFSEKISPFFITAQVIVPYLIGSALVYVYYIPKNLFHERYGWIVLGCMMLIFFSRARYLEDLLFEEEDERGIRLMRGFIITTIVIYAGSRLLMHGGFTFGKV